MVNWCGKPPNESVMSHLEKRKDKYYAVLTIPKELRSHFKGKLRHVETTGTGDKSKAQVIAYRLVIGWKEEFEILRGTKVLTEDSPITTALAIKRQLHEAGEPGTQYVTTEYDYLRLAVEDMVERAVEKGDKATADSIYHIALMNNDPITTFLDEWEGQLHLKPKQVERMRKDAELLADYFPYVSKVTAPAAREWANHLLTNGGRDSKGVGLSSVERIFGSSRNLWSYLQEIGKAPYGEEPLKTPPFIKRQKVKQGVNSWNALSIAEVNQLHQEAMKKQDHLLADLIELGMFTGARINELCHLKCSECSPELLKITDSKTKAGIREVPVHSKLKPTVTRLIEASKDGYLLSRLSSNKHGSRSDAIGKRFGRLKTSLGYPSLKVFHSIRKTVTTLLENAGVTENLTADIIGHDKPRITYGLYSDGHSLEKKREAIELIYYSQ